MLAMGYLWGTVAVGTGFLIGDFHWDGKDLSEAEVDDLDVSTGGFDDISRFQVTKNNSDAVQVLQALEDLLHMGGKEVIFDKAIIEEPEGLKQDHLSGV